MNVEYRTQKELPCDELYQLFLAVGWATEDTTQEMIIFSQYHVNGFSLCLDILTKNLQDQISAT